MRVPRAPRFVAPRRPGLAVGASSRLMTPEDVRLNAYAPPAMSTTSHSAGSTGASSPSIASATASRMAASASSRVRPAVDAPVKGQDARMKPSSPGQSTTGCRIFIGAEYRSPGSSGGLGRYPGALAAAWAVLLGLSGCNPWREPGCYESAALLGEVTARGGQSSVHCHRDARLETERTDAGVLARCVCPEAK